MTILSIKYYKTRKKGWKIYRRVSGDYSYSYQVVSPSGKRRAATTLKQARRILTTKKQPKNLNFKILPKSRRKKR